MKIRVYGPKNPIYTLLDDGKTMIPPLDVSVSSLIEALEEYCTFHKVKLEPNGFCEDPSISNKYFIHKDLESGEEKLVDIHILRGVTDHILKGCESICIEQNLNFEIQDRDIIDMGPLIC